MRKEYPRPNYVRESWESLNGEWDFWFDDKNEFTVTTLPSEKMKINVPFAFQTKLSGINKREHHDYIWYKKEFTISSKETQDIVLHFGAIDFHSKIFVNGQMIKEHVGGSTPISLIVPKSQDMKYEIVVWCYDPLFDESVPRGKQFWEEKSRGIWYTPTSGIWQSVWYEVVDKSRLEKVYYDSDVDTGIQTIRYHFTQNCVGKSVKTSVSYEGEIVSEFVEKIVSEKTTKSFDLYNDMIFKMPFHSGGSECICWTPDNPRLFDVQFTILDGETAIDEVSSYFGFRKISIENGMTYLNNNPCMMKLVLDQGYWEEGLLTAPSDDDFKLDIKLSKEMGFNGCRKHQKVEDPRFLYWADKLGFLVWGEVESAPVYNSVAVENMQKLWFEIIERDYNHPSIVCWVPLNESWGVPNIKFDSKQQAHSLALYYQIKSLDASRLVVNNDGWEQTVTDIMAFHNYNHGALNDEYSNQYFRKVLTDKELFLQSRAAGKPNFADGFEYAGQPILLTEFGGIAYDKNHPEGWGYTAVTTSEDLVSEYGRILNVIRDSDFIYGYCYTQLTDVEQEVNGLYTYNREEKCDKELIKKINDSMNFWKVIR